MCGICGFTRASETSEDDETLKRMCDMMAHRGPDGEGRYLAPGIALGHRRLSLIDLAGGAQPMVRDRWSIVFNGEIYNYRELRSELEGLGYRFSTESDTETLLVGYIAWSEKVLERVRGMFAFAIYDAFTQELFCARDFFGIKPFYYTVQNGQFIFASEIKCILEHPAYERALNEEAFAHYLCFQFSALPETFFKGVLKLPQGHCMHVHNDGAIDVARYWKPTFHFDETRSLKDTVSAIESALHESVLYHNVADVEVGSFLSSGIDSSYLTALLSQENPEIKTFTVGFSEYRDERNEISWAKELAEIIHAEHDSKHITEEEFWHALPLVQWHMDEPSADPSAVALYFVDQLAARRVKAVLSGEGADELFGGYRIYQAPLASQRAKRVPAFLLRAGAHALQSAGKRGAHFLDRASKDVSEWYYTNANDVAFSPEEREAVLSDEMKARLAQTVPSSSGNLSAQSPQTLTAPYYDEVAALDDVTRMQYIDLCFWLVGDILLKTDKMAMAHSLESRVPFLDREVFELAATIPVAQKVDRDQTKIALRAAAERSIPHDWAQKEKLGFPVPVVKWLREDANYQRLRRTFESDLAAQFFDITELVKLLDDHRDRRADNTRRIWIAYSFLVWYRIYFIYRAKPE